MPNQTRQARFKKRLSCQISQGAKRYTGLILDLSNQGLFVQTSALPKPGQALQVLISAPGLEEAVSVTAEVVRAKLVPPQLRNLAHGGVGLYIPEPGPEYLELVRKIDRPAKIQKVSVLPDSDKSDRGAKEKKLSRERLDEFFGVAERMARIARRKS